MRLLHVALVALSSLAGVAPALSAEKTISVTGPGCDYKIRFDPAKVDAKKLKDTADLLLGEGLPGPEYAGRAPTDAVTAAMIEPDRAKCLAPLAKARGASLLDLPGLKELLAGRIEAVEDGCAFQTVLTRALVAGASPAVLLEHKASVAACGSYAKALETPAAMRARWRADVEKQCVNNASPAQCRKTSFALEQKPDADELIRRDVIAFYWNNCANELTKYSQNQDKDEAALEALRKAFKKQFKTREKCEEG